MAALSFKFLAAEASWSTRSERPERRKMSETPLVDVDVDVCGGG
jgi:hypothetical protein